MFQFLVDCRKIRPGAGIGFCGNINDVFLRAAGDVTETKSPSEALDDTQPNAEKGPALYTGQ